MPIFTAFVTIWMPRDAGCELLGSRRAGRVAWSPIHHLRRRNGNAPFHPRSALDGARVKSEGFVAVIFPAIPRRRGCGAPFRRL